VRFVTGVCKNGNSMLRSASHGGVSHGGVSRGGVSIGVYSRRDGDGLTTAVYALSGPLLLTFLASILQSAASIVACTNSTDCLGLRGYSVALGIVSASLLLVFAIAFSIEYCRERIHEKTLMILCGGLFVWWIVGVAVTTFQITVIPDTRYFATWASLIFSALVAVTEFDQFSALVDELNGMERHSQATFYLLLASVVETAAAVFPCVDVACSGLVIYAIVFGGLSVLLCLILLILGPGRWYEIGSAISIFLVFWWTVGLGVLTLSGPFPLGGNGFFACWSGFLLSFFVAQNRMFPPING
jgi:hypothetical protein